MDVAEVPGCYPLQQEAVLAHLYSTVQYSTVQSVQYSTVQCYPLQQEAVLAHLAPLSGHLTGREEVGVAEVTEDLQQQLAGQREDGQGHRSMATRQPISVNMSLISHSVSGSTVDVFE